MNKIRRALISLTDKSGIAEFAAELVRTFRMLQGDKAAAEKPSTANNRPKITQWA